jgi:hypothetical protein
MSLPASGSVMSMSPTPRRARSRAISAAKRVSVSARGLAVEGGGALVTEYRSIASAMPPWKPWCAITETSARANSSLDMK